MQSTGNENQIIEISSSSMLEYDTSYTMYMDISAITDEFNNPFLDLSLASIYTFRTVPELTLRRTIPPSRSIIKRK